MSTNASALSSCPCHSLSQFHKELLQMNVMKLCSCCGFCVAGEMVTKQPLIRSMRTVKRETLKLISGWVSRSNDPQMVRNSSEIISLLGKSHITLEHTGLIF